VNYKTNKPTDSELEILSILWNFKKASVRMVHDELSKHKESGYTTTLKLMQIMHEKKLVWRDESNKSHIYEPAITKENTQTLLLSKMIQNVFSGSSSDLIMHALGNNHTNSEELNKIEALIKQLKSK
jgi:predicted transcriptional regulator